MIITSHRPNIFLKFNCNEYECVPVTQKFRELKLTKLLKSVNYSFWTNFRGANSAVQPGIARGAQSLLGGGL